MVTWYITASHILGIELSTLLSVVLSRDSLGGHVCVCTVYCTVYCMVVRMYGMVGCTTVRMDVEKYSI